MSRVKLSPALAGLRYQEVPGKGHCFFIAIAMYLNRDVAELRGLVANALAADFERFRAFTELTEAEFELYIMTMRDNNTWAGEAEIKCIEHYFRRPIIIIRSDAEPTIPDNLAELTGEPIFVHFSVNHYNALLLEQHANPHEIAKVIQVAIANHEPVRCLIDTPELVKPAHTVVQVEPDKSIPDYSLNAADHEASLLLQIPRFVDHLLGRVQSRGERFVRDSVGEKAETVCHYTQRALFNPWVDGVLGFLLFVAFTKDGLINKWAQTLDLIPDQSDPKSSIDITINKAALMLITIGSPVLGAWILSKLLDCLVCEPYYENDDKFENYFDNVRRFAIDKEQKDHPLAKVLFNEQALTSDDATDVASARLWKDFLRVHGAVISELLARTKKDVRTYSHKLEHWHTIALILNDADDKFPHKAIEKSFVQVAAESAKTVELPADEADYEWDSDADATSKIDAVSLAASLHHAAQIADEQLETLSGGSQDAPAVAEEDTEQNKRRREHVQGALQAGKEKLTTAADADAFVKKGGGVVGLHNIAISSGKAIKVPMPGLADLHDVLKPVETPTQRPRSVSEVKTPAHKPASPAASDYDALGPRTQVIPGFNERPGKVVDPWDLDLSTAGRSEFDRTVTMYTQKGDKYVPENFMLPASFFDTPAADRRCFRPLNADFTPPAQADNPERYESQDRKVAFLSWRGDVTARLYRFVGIEINTATKTIKSLNKLLKLIVKDPVNATAEQLQSRAIHLTDMLKTPTYFTCWQFWIADSYKNTKGFMSLSDKQRCWLIYTLLSGTDVTKFTALSLVQSPRFEKSFNQFNKKFTAFLRTPGIIQPEAKWLTEMQPLPQQAQAQIQPGVQVQSPLRGAWDSATRFFRKNRVVAPAYVFEPANNVAAIDDTGELDDESRADGLYEQGAVNGLASAPVVQGQAEATDMEMHPPGGQQDEDAPAPVSLGDNSQNIYGRLNHATMENPPTGRRAAAINDAEEDAAGEKTPLLRAPAPGRTAVAE